MPILEVYSNVQDVLPICINYGCERPVTKSGKYKLRPVCWKCHQASYGARQLEEGVTFFKKTYCENIDSRLGYECTTYIPYSGALELDHKDGNQKNNFQDNMQTLCKVCHSYKSHINQDYKKNKIVDNT